MRLLKSQICAIPVGMSDCRSPRFGVELAGWQSGRSHLLDKQAEGKLSRGFESRTRFVGAARPVGAGGSSTVLTP